MLLEYRFGLVRWGGKCGGGCWAADRDFHFFLLLLLLLSS